MSDWTLHHTYNRYVRWKLVEPLRCPNDSYALVLRADENFDPAYQCFMCNTLFKPGQGLLDKIGEAVREQE